MGCPFKGVTNFLSRICGPLMHNRFSSVLGLLYLIGFATLAYYAMQGWDYYNLPIQDRPHYKALHTNYKPGGLVGHGVGILGSSMVILLFGYSLRKRQTFGLRFGPMRHWLSIHIWLGFMGPMFITLHTAMKFHGIITVSYFSMMAVMLSGFVGRYIYSQVPHSASGDTLSLNEIDSQIAAMGQVLTDREDVQWDMFELTQKYAGNLQATSGARVWLHMIVYDLTRWIRPWLFRQALREAAPDLSAAELKAMTGIAQERSHLIRRRAFLNAVNSVFDLWHIIHKPFAWVAMIIMCIHIILVVSMGYTWIF